MIQQVMTNPGEIIFREVPVPEVKDDQVLVKIMNIGRDITNIAQKIRSGTSETLISSQYDFSNIKSHNYSKFSDDDVRMICSLICSNLSDDEILLKLGYDIMNESREFRYLLRKRIRSIRNRISFQEISKDYQF